MTQNAIPATMMISVAGSTETSTGRRGSPIGGAGGGGSVFCCVLDRNVESKASACDSGVAGAAVGAGAGSRSAGALQFCADALASAMSLGVLATVSAVVF